MNLKLDRITIRPELLRAARNRAGLTQAEAARLLGLSRQTLWSYERGRGLPSANVLARICVLYGVTPQDLVRPQPASSRLT